MPQLIGRILAALVAVAVLIASFFVGAIAVVTLFGLALFAWLVALLRISWLRHKQRTGRDTGSTTVEGEYRVVEHHREDDTQ